MVDAGDPMEELGGLVGTEELGGLEGELTELAMELREMVEELVQLVAVRRMVLGELEELEVEQMLSC